MGHRLSNLPSPSDLAYFLEIAAVGNLSRAANRLGLSQPSLSLSIRRLETQIGVALLRRSRTGVELTPAGVQLASRAKRLVESWEQIGADAARSTNEVVGSYTIGCHVSVALYSLPSVLPKLVAEFPGLDLKLIHDLSRKIAEDVVARRADLGIVINPPAHPELVLRPLGTDSVGFWAAKKAPHDVLIYDPDLVQSQDLLKRAARQAFQPLRHLTTTSLEVVRELTLSGAGVGILPGRVVAGPRAEKSPAVLPLKHLPTYEDRIVLVYRSEDRDLRAVRVISERVQAIFR